MPDVLSLALLVVVPGTLALRLLGIRGLAALAAAPPVTMAAVGVVSVLFAPLRVAWWLPAVLGALAVSLVFLAGAAWVVRRWRPTDHHDGGAWYPPQLRSRGALAVAAAVVAGATVLAVPFITALPAPDAPLQQWDGVFHLNAVVTVRETGIATPLGGLAPLYGAGALAPYYPTGWHALVALAPGLSVPAATNAAILVLGVGVWVLGIAGLAREVFLRHHLPSALAPLLAATFVAFPAVQLTVLAQLANGLSTALLPGALLLTVRAVRAVRAQAGAAATTGAVVATVAGASGVVVAHASGLFAFALLAGPLLVGAVGGWGVRLVRGGHRMVGAAVVMTLALVVAASPMVLADLDALSSVVNFERGSGRSHAAALGEVLLDRTLTASYGGDGWQHVVVTGATLAGIVLVLVRRCHRWLVVAFALSVGLAVLAAGPESHPLRWLAGFWYTQAARIAPVVVVPAVLLAAYALTNGIGAVRSRLPEPTVHRVAVTAVIASVVAFAVIRVPLQERVVASAFVPGELAWETMATAEELALMRSLELPPEAVVVGDPFNGSALLPAVAGVNVVFPQLGASGMSSAQFVLQERLADIHTDPSVCSALEDVGATHLYQDSARRSDGAKVSARTSGMRDVDVSSGFTEVARKGTAAIYRIELCDIRVNSEPNDARGRMWTP